MTVKEFSVTTVENLTPDVWIGPVNNCDRRLYQALNLIQSRSFLLGCGLGLLMTIGYFNLTAGKAETEPLRFPPALKNLESYR
ncbi:hypothetical protein IQ260_06925 [Leptolyngbya cf. ectocarpi LEGE 11479]|uniref:Uncharacterized protein n=1 Tax=Leptolyngbya cf. ectocarpi LEGE 11479 TaxID=1828722 RepID=A0A928WZW2_LEPEC|nr:hypothetical protein [Leptolyngbya ectocarpi]MBE9066382.1 hypothetical protein [Leptolyngbya cf. ectocarpi LEGE 11479]